MHENIWQEKPSVSARMALLRRTTFSRSALSLHRWERSALAIDVTLFLCRLECPFAL